MSDFFDDTNTYDLRDTFVTYPITAREDIYQGRVVRLVSEDVELPTAGVVRREFVEHPGAVGIVALNDLDQIAMVHQYRHPVRQKLWELPAGLLDIEGEPPWEAARRELAEETDLVADRWHTLVDWYNSPGGMDEAVRVYLARGISDSGVRHERVDEELGMVTAWFDLDVAHAAVLSGRIHNPGSVVGILAAYAARAAEWTPLRPYDASWAEHKAFRG